MGELVSIICTVKNGEKTIEETIRSVNHQTYENWELIIVDDGSTDNTLSIINRFAQADARIKVIETSGIGRGRALNLALEHCQGNYIANVDVDDPMHPERIRLQLNALKNHPDYDLIATATEIIIDNEKPKWKKVHVANEVPSIVKINSKLLIKNPISHSSVMFTKQSIRLTDGYSCHIPSQFDYDLWMKMDAKKLNLGYTDLPLSSKRIHRDQSFENKKRLKYLLHSLKIQSQVIRNNHANLYYFIAILRFLYGILPIHIRKMLKRHQKFV